MTVFAQQWRHEKTGAHDLSTDGGEGFIIPIRDAAAITDCLQKLAEKPDLRIRMSETALRRVESIVGSDQYGEKIFQIFSEGVRS
jgi:starch synthase